MPARRTPARPDTPCRKLWNLSDTTAAWLADEGIHTHGDLVGSDLMQLWARLRARHPQVTKLMFLALAGAVHDVHWRHVPSELVEAFERWRAGAAVSPPARQRAPRKAAPRRRPPRR
ncbi:MAG: TfoX/Sxy family protein [Planctomycetes bacterium]|jgi:DNA transformation protein|nr:TfoX/Sxy family protein [Planctomycetota bacterium]